MLGELVAQQAGQAVVQDVCSRARKNGCNLLLHPADRLESNFKVGCLAVQDALPDP